MFDNPMNPFTVYRVTDAGRLAEIETAVGAPLLEACRIPGRGVKPSTFRAWTKDGACYEMWKSGPQAMQPRRAAGFDRTEKLAGAPA